MRTRKFFGVSLVPLIMVLALLCLAAPSSTATAQTHEVAHSGTTSISPALAVPAAAVASTYSTAPTTATASTHSTALDTAAVPDHSTAQTTAAVPATSTVQGTALVPTASAVVNFAQLAQQEITNPGPAKPTQAVPRTLPGGQDSNGAASNPSAASTQPNPADVPSSPSPVAAFEALGDNNTAIPAGVSGAVGQNHILTALNSQIRIQNRSGATLSTLSTVRFWSSVLPTGSAGAFDLRAVYDAANNRWILVAASDASNGNSAVDVAVSATSDPTGTWYLFRYDADAQNLWWANYPMLGFNKDWIVVSANMFANSSNAFVQGQVFALNKANLYGNNGAGGAVFTGSAVPFSLQPAETYDNTLDIEYLVRNVNSGNGTVAKSTLTGAPPSLPTLTIDTATFTSNLGGWSIPSGNTLPQSGASTGLDAGDARVQQVVARTVNGQTSIWFVQDIALPAGGAPTHTAVQWWEVDGSSAASATILQQGRIEDTGATQTNGGENYAYPSLAVNQNNDVLIGYGRFSSNEYPSAAYSFRAGTDAANTMRGTTLLKVGEGAYVKTLGNSLNRWGDFSHTVVDPADNTSLWTIQAYAASPVGAGDGSGRWATWWGQIQPSASGGPVTPPSGTTTCYTLTTGINPGGGGSITTNPAPNCNNGTQYTPGTAVSLTAYANSGYGFSSWSGDASGSSNPVTITLDANKSVVAYFAGSTSSAFGKSSPSNDATGQSTALTLSWNGSSGADSYEYCVDTSDNNLCDNSWTNVGTNTSVDISGLTGNTTYFWQVRALDANGNIMARADAGTWWNFATGAALPNAFGKNSPSNGATGQAQNPTLSWGSSGGATSYQYCIDTTNNSSCDGSWIDVGTRTSVTLGGLSNNTTYYWQVQAENAQGTTAANSGTWWSFTTHISAPGAFSKSNPANGATGRPTTPTLSWTGSSGATGYQYCLDTTNNNSCDGNWKSADNRTSVKLNGLNYNTTYYWQVRAQNSGGTTAANGGKWWSFTTVAAIPVANDDFGSATSINSVPFTARENTTNATTASDDPSFACAGTQGAASVWFSFTPASDGLLRANTTGSSYNTILAVWKGSRGSLSSVACNDNKSGVGTSALSVSLAGGTTYYLEVAGRNVGGGLVLNAGFVGIKPAAVTLLSPANGSQSTTPSQVLDWSNSAGATFYGLEVRKGSATGALVVSAQPTASTYTTGNLDPARYFWKVQACNTNGCSAWSATWSFQIKGQSAKPARPTLTGPANGSKISGQANLNWTDSAGATYYQVDVRRDKNTGPVVASLQPTDSAVTTSDLKRGHWYYWRVQACNDNGCSAWTGWWRFRIQ